MKKKIDARYEMILVNKLSGAGIAKKGLESLGLLIDDTTDLSGLIDTNLIKKYESKNYGIPNLTDTYDIPLDYLFK